jgi:hypothetical protein
MAKHYDSRGYEKDDEPATEKGGVSTSDRPREPRVGDMVHYRGAGPGPSPLAAIITQVDGDGCYLAVFTKSTTEYLKAPYSDVAAPGSWSWIP